MNHQEKKTILRRLINIPDVRVPEEYAEYFMRHSFFMYRFQWFRVWMTKRNFKSLVRENLLDKYDTFYLVTDKGYKMVLAQCTDNNCTLEH